MSSNTKHTATSKHRGSLSLVFAVLLGIVGITALVVGVISQQSAPRPAMSIAPSSDVETVSKSSPDLGRSLPVKIDIPSIGVSSEVKSVGKNPDGTIEVPVGKNYDKAAWYKSSPTPGEIGAAVIIGHVDSVERGPSVFFRLGALKANDEISVKRADGKDIVYKVDAVKEYSKDDFPTEEVYGSSGNSTTLRLVTCGGDFEVDDYTSNVVVYGTYLRS